MLVCPYCEQDDIWTIRHKKLNKEVALCFECDTAWNTPGDVEYGKGQNYEEFMAGQGLTPEWTSIVKINKL